MKTDTVKTTQLRRLQAVRLTDAAAARVKAAMTATGDQLVGLRVGVKNGGCAGMSYTMEYAKAINPGDEVVEDKGVRILIDPKALLFLLGESDFMVPNLEIWTLKNIFTRNLPLQNFPKCHTDSRYASFLS